MNQSRLIKAKQSYTIATEASKKLFAGNPTRLGIALNYSVFLHTIMDEPEYAIKVSKNAFDDAIKQLD